jgi:hypothetical protein
LLGAELHRAQPYTARGRNASPNHTTLGLYLTHIAGNVFPTKAAEELLATLPGVVSARIIADDAGGLGEVHVLMTPEFTPKQMVRNIESALIAHLGVRVDHRKISVATTTTGVEPRVSSGKTPTPSSAAVVAAAHAEALSEASKRRLYFEDVEVRRSRTKGVACRVTLRKGDAEFEGEAEGADGERLRVDLAARATIVAIAKAEGADRTLALEGTKLVEAFDREFVFVGIKARIGRETVLLTGSCEVRESAETASVLAVLDATNRWLAVER